MSFDNEKNKNYFIIVIIFIIICIYGVFSIYFIKHFYFGTYINEINVSCKTVKEANELLLKESYNYTIKLEERNDVTEYIKGSNINFEYKGSKETEEIKTSQNPFLWIVNIFSNNKYIINEVYSFDRNLLKEELEKLNCFNSEDIVEPIDSCLKYEDGEFKIIKEVYGNKINEEFLYAYLLNSILLGERCINLDEINAYENPKFTSESEKVIKAQNELNKYVSSEIYYIFDNEIEVLDSSIINTWLEVDSTMNVVINEEKIKEYIKTLGIKYDTYGKTRSFKSTTGKNINVIGGNYGWRIDRTKEKEALIKNIKSGEIIKKEPIYLQTALGNHENDIGNTYVEINLTNQYLWFYKSGKIITQGDVVTGNVSRGNATPQGTYTLNYKQKNATLRGVNYNSDVKYWMPFNMNIGIHDASWRNSFGGNIYQTSGSHGCVNAPEYLAKKIFENIEPGTPIICYKDE
ncbi:MAG: peptidoglycan binding domain-containing protein [Clostridium sp.]|uniref:L,D-transpeptidase family protein n=1 Tax=Clostridium sp. TaxID=1506 RepID=UPI0039920968